MSTRTLTKPVITPSIFDDFLRPWSEMFDENRWMNKMLTVPAVNIYEKFDHYLISLAIPGMKKEDLHITLEGNMLTINTEKEAKLEEQEEKFTRREYNYTNFTRSFTVPEDVKSELIDAKYEDGVLYIKLPRKVEEKENFKMKTVEVK